MLLFIVCIAIVVFLPTTVVPRSPVFPNSNAPLPLLTQIMIAMSDSRAYGIYLLMALIAAGFLFYRWLKVGANRATGSSAAAALLGRVCAEATRVAFARTLSTLTASTVPVLEALRISGEVVTNLPMRQAVADAAVRVREGAPIGRSLGQSRLFPPMLVHLISSGESSGELDTMLERAAAHQERELDAILQGVVGLLGPLMILVMGGLVLTIVIAMLMPIFKLNELVH